MFRTCALAALLSFIPIAQAQQPPIDQAKALQALEQEVDQKRKDLFIPGASLAVIKDDKIVLLTGLGYRDLASKKPVTPDTLFAIGSCSKAFTSMLMAMAADEDKVKFTDSPKKYLPYFRMADPDTDKNITISDMLSHRSGLPRTDLIMLGDNLTSEDIIWNVTRAKPTAKLGERWQYQNIMFVAAGKIEEKVEGDTWGDLVKQRIFDPLGMKRTNVTVPDTLKDPDHSLGYDGAADYAELPMRPLPNVAPAGAINSSAREMAEWVRYLLNGGEVDGKQLVSKENFDELWKPRITIVGNMKYGYGWMLDDWNGHKVVQHGGNIDGFNAQVALMPDQHLGMVLLTNVSASSLGSIAMESLWKNMIGAPASPDKIVALTNPDQEVGTYTLKQANLDFEVTHEGDHLYVHPTGQPKMDLLPLGNRRYKIGPPAPDKIYVTFMPSKENPKQTVATLEQSGMKFNLVPPSPYVADISVDTLMSKTLAAMGGEDNFRKVRTITYRYEYDMDNQGIKNWGVVTKVAPTTKSALSIFTAGGRRFAWDQSTCNGSEAVEVGSFGTSDLKGGAALADLSVEANISQELNWRTLFKKVAITGSSKVGGEDVYVVKKTPAVGDAVTDYISKTSFMLLKREYTEGPEKFSDEYRDYKPLNGIQMAMTISRETTQAGKGTVTIIDPQINGPVDGALLKMPSLKS